MERGGFIRDIVCEFPPVLVEIATTFGGSFTTSFLVSPNWNVSSSIRYTKYDCVVNPVAWFVDPS